jgi:hypothetical protein
MKKTVIFIAVMMFVSVALGSLVSAKPSKLSNDIQILPPAEGLPAENLAFYGKSGKWQGYWEVLGRPGSKAEAAIVFKQIGEKEAEVIMALAGNPQYFAPDIYQPETIAKFKTKKGITTVVMPAPSQRDMFATVKFWVANGVLHGERVISGSTVVLTLQPVDSFD